jgi:hypothetical protein
MRSRATRWTLLAIAVACVALALSPQGLIARLSGDRLQVTPIGLHFLTGKALDRLHDGAAVPFAFRLALSDNPQPPPLQSSFARFTVSYDVWSERFKIVQQSVGTRKFVTNLASNAAEAWCVNQLGLAGVNVPTDRDLWIRLDIRAEDPMPRLPISDAGFTLSSLIDIFSRSPRSETQEWNAETAPFRLNSLRQ